MMPKQFSMSTKKRDPLKMANAIELNHRIPEALKSSVRAALRMAVICVAVADGKKTTILFTSLLNACWSSPPKKIPRRASRARKKGSIANNRLYARAAERVHDQSLLNLFQKSCKGFMAFIPF